MGKLHSAQAMGEDTLQNLRNVQVSLHAQGETMDNIEKTQIKIDSNLKKGDHIVASMTTWKGWFKSIIRGNNDDKAEAKQMKDHEKEKMKREQFF